ncbi:hypothetical protein [Candidatus Scalindua japonica]|uniref:hypothetical protein n=1 Tax=Candidatus Scalindua japonica TaxID=1284222 RepID=UPI0010548E07|nr:hypothetical protein [Candidatus Scalindua japonica]
MTFSILGNSSILASETIPNTLPGQAIYDVGFTGAFSGITGIRLGVFRTCQFVASPWDRS